MNKKFLVGCISTFTLFLLLVLYSFPGEEERGMVLEKSGVWIDNELEQTILQDLHQSSFECPVEDRFILDPIQPSPDYLLIGVAKGGTTSFSNYLPIHPNVVSVDPKEPNFFSWKFRPTNVYQAMFVNVDTPKSIPPGSDVVISGEYTTSYILHPLTPKRVYTELPHIKIIVLLRNPIDRAFSHYTMSKRAHIETLSFEEIIQKELGEIGELRYKARECFNNPICDPDLCLPEISLHAHNSNHSLYPVRTERDLQTYFYTSYLYRSIYDDAMERWMSVFPREQILILNSEEFFEDPARELDKVADFLGLPPFDFSSDPILSKSWGGGASNKYEKPHDYEPLNNETREFLQEFFEPYNQRLYKIIGQDYGWK